MVNKDAIWSVSKLVDGKWYSTTTARLIAVESKYKVFWRDIYHTKFLRGFLYRQNKNEYFVIRQIIEKTYKGEISEINYLEPISLSSARIIHSGFDIKVPYEDAFEQHDRYFTISEIMKTLKLNEPDTRKLLREVGAQISDLDTDPSETVSDWVVGSLMTKFWDSSKGSYTQEGFALGELLNNI